MTDFLLDNNHDIVFNDQQYVSEVTGAEKLAQTLKISLLLYRGEWFRDINKGVPYFQEILGLSNTKTVADLRIKQTIQNTNGVTSILEYTSTLNNSQEFDVTFKAASIYGEVNLTVGL